MKEGLFARTGLQCNELLTERYDSIEPLRVDLKIGGKEYSYKVR